MKLANRNTHTRARRPYGEHGLSSRQLEFLALGSSIGAGLFLGSGTGVRIAGPAIVLAYLLTGAVVFTVARALADLALNSPRRGTFIVHLEHNLGPRTAFVGGWGYWIVTVLVGMAELTAAGIFTHTIWPAIPQWLATGTVFIALAAINLPEVSVFGEIEVWAALLKVGALTAFVIGGTAAVFLLPSTGETVVGFSNLWRDGGFFPMGLSGLIAALPIALFGFGGMELVGIAAAETRNPEQALPKATNRLGIRILVFYAGTMTIALSLVPWRTIGVDSSPFVLALQAMHVPAIAALMNIILLTATISSANSVVFASTRVLASLADIKAAPKCLARLNKHDVPSGAVFVALLAMSAAIVLNLFAPDIVFGLLLSSAALTVAVDWMLFLLAHLRSDKRRTADRQRYVLPGAPWTNIAAIVVILLVLSVSLFDHSQRPASICCVVIFVLLWIAARFFVPTSAAQLEPLP